MKIVMFIGLFFPLLYIGCGEIKSESGEKSSVIDQKHETTVLPESPSSDLLKELGFNFENEKFSIDINRTNSFLEKMEIEMHGKADELQHKIEKADINFTRDIGLSFEKEKVEIDLNKTRKMFQQINILMKEVLLDGNSSKY